MFKNRPVSQVVHEFKSQETDTTGANNTRDLPTIRLRSCFQIIQLRLNNLGGQRKGPNIITGMGQSNILDLIINDNRDLWDRLVGHSFCSRMGNGTARVEGFKDFATNELLFLRNEVRYHLGLYSKMDDWDVLSTKAPAALVDAVNLADHQLQVCIQGLGIPKAALLSIVPKPQVKAYMDWVNGLINTEDWLSLLVLMAPCFLGYTEITTKLFNDPVTKKDTIFYKLWIEPTAGDPGLDEFVQGYRAWFDKSMKGIPPSPSVLRHWTDLFRKACEMEISFFDIGL